MSNYIDKLQDRFNGSIFGITSRLVFLIEAFAVAGAFIISFLSLSLFTDSQKVTGIYILFGILAFVSRQALSQVTVLAMLPRTQKYRTLLFRFLQVSFIDFIICSLIWFAIGLHSIPFVIVPTYIILSFSLTFIIRVLTYKVFRHYRAKGYNTKYLIVIADSFSDGVIDELVKQKEWGFHIKYILSDSKLIKAKYSKQAKVFGENANLRFLLELDVIDSVIYCKNKIVDNQMKETLKICEELGVLFRMQSNLSPLEPVKLQLETVNHSPYLQLVDNPSRRFGIMIKNITDIYISASALLLLAPVMITLALIIKIGSKGPVFFIQERIGLHGRKFKLFKFRTMVQNAEALKTELEKDNEADGPVFKIKHDPRITRVGRLLRKTGLDELPQLINVVIGEMSLIGPRPPVAKEVIKYERWQLRRLSVKPGITCTWQILENRNDISFEKWMHLDLDYIDNWTLMSDAKLFFKTFNTIVKASGH